MRRFHNYANAHDDFKTSRRLYFVECLFEYFINILVSGAYLAKLTTTIGISDGMTAILAELTALSGVFQIFSIYLSHRVPVKKWLIPMMTVPQLLFAGVYLIPILDMRLSASFIFFVAILIARAISSIAAPIKTNWYMSLVEPRKRGQFTSTNNIISTVAAMAFTFVASMIIDRFEAEGNMNGAFLTFSIAILVFTFIHVLTLVFSKENAPPTVFTNASPFAAVGDLLKNKKYKRILALYAIFAVASAATTPFLGTYQINELGFSMTFISIMDIVISAINVTVLFLFGKYSMHTTYSHLIRMSHIFYVLGFAFIIVTTPQIGTVPAVLTFIGYRLMLVIGGAARTVSATNLLFGLAPPEDRVTALAINTIVTGVLGFVTTLAFTPLVDYVQTNEITLFGLPIYAQQVLALVSTALFIITMLYYRIGCKKLFEEEGEIF